MFITSARFCFLLGCCLAPALAVWPAPRQIQQGTTPVKLSNNFTITFEESTFQGGVPSDLASAVEYTLRQIEHDHHQLLTKDRGLSLHPLLTNSSTSAAQELIQLEVKLSVKFSNRPAIRSLKEFGWNMGLSFLGSKRAIESDNSSVQGTIAAEMQRPLKARDESYKLTIGCASGSRVPVAVLSAPTALGILRGLQTFSQLVYTVPSPRNTHAAAPREHFQKPISVATEPYVRFIYGPVSIQDAPAFAYRGLLLDTSRNFYPIDDLRRTLEAMSWAKLNVLHWHIVDSQSWPLHIPTYPQLAERGAYSSAETYSAEEVKQLTLYANSKGIEVMLEIDTPGHTSVIGEAYPDLIACKDATPWMHYAAEPPAGQLRIADDAALALVEDIFRYVTREIPGTLFSSGGDEVNKKCYQDDVVTQESLRSKNMTLNQALGRFVTKTHEVIRQSGKTPVVWEELILDEHLDLSRDTPIAVWRSSANVRQVAEAGHPIIHAASDYSYLDCGLGGWLGNSTNGTSWCDPFKTWQKIYSFDPYANITAAQRRQILGGQALLWSEQADGQNLDSLIWPRALSTAEVYWTGTERVRTVTEALPRMHDMRYRLVQRGIRATPLQPHWCAVRPGMCDLPPKTPGEAE